MYTARNYFNPSNTLHWSLQHFGQCKYTDQQTDRDIHIDRERQKGTQTDIHKDRERDREAHRQTEGHTDRPDTGCADMLLSNDKDNNDDDDVGTARRRLTLLL